MFHKDENMTNLVEKLFKRMRKAIAEQNRFRQKQD